MKNIFNVPFARWLAVLAAVASLSQAPAQADESALAQSPALACLTRAASAPTAPAYPPERYARKDGAEIHVSLRFSGADREPAIRVDDADASTDFTEAIREFARHYRIPCMASGDPAVTLRQAYVFIPNDGRKVVLPSELVDDADVARREQLKCVTNVHGMDKPIWPSKALRSNAEEKLFLSYSFSAPDRAPELKWLVEPKNRDFRKALESYLDGLRLPCLKGEPITVTMLYVFEVEENAHTVLKDTTLPKLIGASKDYALPAYFDFNTMGCPFSLRLTYQRPYALNAVHELEASLPARKPLLEWMQKFTFKLEDDVNRKVLGDTMTVTIPCGVLHL
ncbi:MAG: hypothetical protein V4582_16765 [Pseudomonadota bacterium]